MLAPIALSVILILWSLIANLVVGEQLYLLRNLVAVVLLLGLARSAGWSWRDLGLARDGVGSGLRWGAGAMVVVAVVLAIGVVVGDAIPMVGNLLGDRRADQGPAELAWNVLVRIPFGTALFEEVAFRGVLLASFLLVTSTSRAVMWSSLVFGLWHVGPTVVTLRINDIAPTSAVGLRALVGAVLVTAVAGVLFSALRLLSTSLVAPILGHWATNGLGLLAGSLTDGAQHGESPHGDGA